MADAHIPLTLVDWLDDLCVRFLVNLPESELSSVPRLCFQVEEAQWFYEDFVRPAVQASGAPPLPHLPLRQFCLLIFQHCPLLSGFTDAQHLAAYEDFLAYKVRVPVRGAILLDQNMEKLVLVRGWKKGASWSFPRGKINKDERDLDCAIREVYEETGFDLSTSGLIPEHEEDIKYIDVTMREQHMRLFVFRGVPEDTYFETKTRKEISKIQWYWIKDLPGFKKQNKQQQQSEADLVHANKFYMVAPFLGHLKKWISQQRKKDIVEAQRRASATHGLAGNLEQHAAIEDESEDPHYSDAAVGQKEDELKRLLSIGAASAIQTPLGPDMHSGNLLAMLQGGVQTSNGRGPPQTPFEQISTFTMQPNTPQPQHLRQPSVGQQQSHLPPLPQFPYSPQRQPYQQQIPMSQPTPAIFGPLPVPPGYPPNTQAGMLPPHLQQQQFQQRPQQQPLASSFEQQNAMHFNGSIRVPQPQPMPPLPQPQRFPNTLPPNAFMAQGPQGAIASGPAVPSASQLPAPNLNAHTMKLLDAFKGGNNRTTPTPSASAKVPARATGAHQAALLDLFKKPSAQSPLIPPEPPSPAPTDTTVRPRRPSKAQERKPTLNEITRTLPLKTKTKASALPESPVMQDSSLEARPKSRQLFDPYGEDKSKTAKTTAPPPNPHSPVRILQRPSSSQRSSPPTATPTAQPMQDSSSNQNGSQPSAFTILTRPGSSKGNIPPAPSSPLKNGTPTPPFQPQLLKRRQPSAPEREKTPASGNDTKEQLLALFGKSPTVSTPTPQSQPPLAAVETKVATAADTKTTLLDLFKSSTPQPPAATSRTPTTAAPPPAPRIQPTSNPTTSTPPVAAATAASKQQNLLLDLFNNPSQSVTPTAGASPGTPISPFALGTPVVMQGPSIASALAGGGNRNVSASTTPTAKNPVQAKEFLMGYLNGVVKGAGQS